MRPARHLGKRRAADPESGQAMIEFAMIMPILALLTFGTLEVALYLQQQSAINAAAFIGARSASVLGNDASMTKASIKTFTEATGFTWLANARVTQGRADTATIGIAAGAGRLSGLVSGLTGGKGAAFDELSAAATLPLEYNAKKLKSSYSPVSKPQTYLMISYDGEAPVSDVLKNGVRGKVDVLKTYLARAGQALDKVPNVPGLPNLKVYNAIATGQEPFRTIEAVAPNPKDRKSGNDTPAQRSTRYIGPKYEEAKFSSPRYTGSKRYYNINNLLADLNAYGKDLAGDKGIEETSRQIGNFQLPATAPGAPIANAAITAAKVAAGQAGTSLVTAADKQYGALELKEKRLFGR